MTRGSPVPEVEAWTTLAPGWQPPDPAARRGPPAMLRRRARLNLDERAALGMWAAAHVTLLVLAWAAAWVFRGVNSHAPLTGVFEHWDAAWLRNIAQYGYFSPHSMADSTAFFPGYPVVLAAVHLVLRNWVLSELIVPAVAGCFAVVSLTRLAGSRRAVLYLITMPAAIFLMVGYAEALFLALAIPAWRSAVTGQWWRAALLAGLAGLVRPDALYLIPALAVMALTGPRGHRLANAVKACSALAGPAVYEIDLTVRSGWDTWRKANQASWDLHLATPLSALKTSWWAAFRHPFSAGYAFEHQLELGAMAVMVLVTLAFLAFRRWPEAVYCGLAAVSLGAQTWYQTGPRTVLMLFPVCVALAAVDGRRPWIRYVYLSAAAPLAVVVALLFLTYQWAG
jgi:hypothetical protein